MVTKQEVQAISDEIRRLEHILFEAIQRKDPSGISPILTDTFTYQNPAHGEISRTEFLTNIQQLPVEIKSVSSDNLSVKVVSKDLAIITGIQQSEIIHHGEKHTARVAFTDIFIREQGRWLLDYANGIDLS